MTHHVVTGRDLETHTVTLDVPHGVLLTSWQYAAAQAEAAMTQVQGDVFLASGGELVVPSWWDRTTEGRGMWLVWPADYARETGKPRRERVDDVEAVTEKRRRTIAYRIVGWPTAPRLAICSCAGEMVRASKPGPWAG